MPQITVGVDKWLEGEVTAPSIVARIHPLDRQPKKGTRSQTVIIPAGRQAGVSLELPVGRYLIEAYLPSGDVATETVTVASGANAPVLLRATDSPHEWLSWQSLAGQASVLATRGARAPLDAAAQAIGLDVVEDPDPAGLPKALVGVWKGASVATLPLSAVAPRTLSQPMFDAALGLTAYLFDRGPWQEGARYYGLVRQPPKGPVLLAVLPLPWHETDMTGDSLVDVLVDTSDAGATSHREWPVTVSVIVRDSLMTSVFGYLASGDLPTAAHVMESAVDRLAQKMVNSLAAAGAAYILVRSATDQQKRPIWVPWLQNLRNWFPWLPDGAILDGWAHLNGIGRTADANKAAISFVEAVGRGLPFYTSGVRLLYEGMTRLATRGGNAAQPQGFDEAFEIVRRLALRIDVRQTFTVVRLS